MVILNSSRKIDKIFKQHKLFFSAGDFFTAKKHKEIAQRRRKDFIYTLCGNVINLARVMCCLSYAGMLVRNTNIGGAWRYLPLFSVVNFHQTDVK